MTTSSTTRSSTAIPAVVGIALVLVIALAVAFSGDDRAPSGFDLAAVAAPTIQGQAIATGASGVPAPQVRAEALLSEGENELPAEGEGTMILFLAHWCPHCNAEIPIVNRWLTEDGLPEGTELRAVATSIDPTQPNFPPDTWLRERAWTVPTLIDADGSIAAAYGVDSFPYWVFVGADGTVLGAGGAQTQAELVQIATRLAEG